MFFHIGKLTLGTGQESSKAHEGTAALGCPVEQSFDCELKGAQQYGLPLQNALISAQAEAEDRKLRKDPTFGGSLL